MRKLTIFELLNLTFKELILYRNNFKYHMENHWGNNSISQREYAVIEFIVGQHNLDTLEKEVNILYLTNFRSEKNDNTGVSFLKLVS